METAPGDFRFWKLSGVELFVIENFNACWSDTSPHLEIVVTACLATHILVLRFVVFYKYGPESLMMEAIQGPFTRSTASSEALSLIKSPGLSIL